MNEQYMIGEYNIKEVQANLLLILIEIDRICRKHNIKYTIEGGTLLGAIKYKGFVPWDDDIDIVMLREHYEKFIRVCRTELDYKYFLQNNKNVREYTLSYSKLCMNNTLYVQSDSQQLNIHHGLFVDIFPIDNIKPKTFKAQLSILRALNGALAYKVYKTYNNTTLTSNHVIKNLSCRILSYFPSDWLIYLSNYCMTFYNNKKTTYVFEVCTGKQKMEPLKRNVYEELVEVEFMGKNVLATKYYDEFIRSRFGDIKELPPIDKRVPSHNIIKCKL